ncbi:hypothetical protein HO133_000899 [Letharia lupina]|uniref:Pre-mRNA-splicing factor 38B n=1 Tax=Letharia lupina TaxID=560253 RepID=A0A8H6CGA9_9LECA|nr:uncharacterized protein HO133_000899 [Letharia lupina]KAF6222848.1 hypothetical protein HO133_000899 [Letharia lupina]
MSGSEPLPDDYVAQLLAKDAKASNAKYSAYGLQEHLPRRRASVNPNTRFLKNIIRETNNHNAALRTKEVEESRARLRDLRDSDKRISSPRDSSIRLNSEGHHRSKRRRTSGEDEGERDLRRHLEGRHSGRDKGEVYRSNASSRKHLDDRYGSEDDEEERHHKRRHRHHHRTHPRPDDNELYEHDRRSTKNRRRSRSRQPPSPRSDGNNRQRHHRSHRPARDSSSATTDSNRRDSSAWRVIGDQAPRSSLANGDANGEKRATSPGSDSDPLDAIIGPPPPPPAPKVQARGRGNFSSSSAMDSHFSSNYDPSVDVHPDPEMDDDWDEALEAIRDRQRWQKLGAERLKSAGFTEEEVKKWETGGEKREEDVKWKGRGEGREWDRGKVVGDDGVETRPEWGRLKGT